MSNLCAFCLTTLPTPGLEILSGDYERTIMGRPGSRFENAIYRLKPGVMGILALTTDSSCDECLHAMRLLDAVEYLGQGDYLHEPGRVLTPPPKRGS